MEKPDTLQPVHATVLCGRYEWVRELGQGAQGRTFLARDLQNGCSVTVKELVIYGLEHWKAMELFEREAQALKSISHPAIPAYIDFFQLPQEAVKSWQPDVQGDSFFLVQEFVDGVDFKHFLADGGHFTEKMALDFLDEMLGILSYLHAHTPSVIHRDIKPSNIIRRADADKTQRLALVDFGAVQAAFPDQVAGSTVVGTSGYMPIEQLMGRAVAASDLYALGATLVHLLSQRHPHTLPVEALSLQFQEFINVSPALRKTLAKMLAPHVEDRFQTADEVREFLAHGLAEQHAAGQLARIRSAGQSASLSASVVRFHPPGAGQKGVFNTLIYESMTDLNLSDENVLQAPETLLSKIEASGKSICVTIPRARRVRFAPLWVGGIAIMGVAAMMVADALAKDLVAQAVVVAVLCIISPLIAGIAAYFRASAEVCVEVNPKHLSYTRNWRFYSKSKTFDLESIQAMRYRPTIGASLVRESPIIGFQSETSTIVFGGYLPSQERRYLMATVGEAIVAART